MADEKPVRDELYGEVVAMVYPSVMQWRRYKWNQCDGEFTKGRAKKFTDERKALGLPSLVTIHPENKRHRYVYIPEITTEQMLMDERVAFRLAREIGAGETVRCLTR